MRYCTICGAEVSDGAKFCPKCGTKLQEPDQEPTGGAPNFQAGAPSGTGSAEAADPQTAQGVLTKATALLSSPRNRILACAAAAVIVVVIVVILVAVAAGSRVNLNKYIVFTESGYDGYGTVSASFDYEAFYNGPGKHLKVKQNMQSETGASMMMRWGYTANEAALEVLADDVIYFRLDNSSGLSNGSTVTLSWDSEVQSEMRAYFGLKANCKDLSYTMENLEPTASGDIFTGVTVTFSGYDTLGSAALETDSDRLIVDNLKYTLDQTGNLSNGDTVTVTAEVSGSSQDLTEYCARSFGVVPTRTTMTVTVSGLEDIPQVDVFEDIQVTFSGVSGRGTASYSIDSSSDMVNGLSYSLDVSSSLSNGDTVTLTVGPGGWFTWGEDVSEYSLNNYGAVPAQTSKTYTVEGLDEFVSDPEDIPSDTLSDMKSQGEDVVRAKLASDLGDRETLNSLTYVGCYLLTLRDLSDTRNSGNLCSLVYEINVTSTDTTVDYYYYVRFRNVLVQADGTGSVDLTNYSTTYASFRTTNFKYTGFDVLDNLFSECVTEYQNKYDYVSSVEGDARDGSVVIPTDAESFNGHHYKTYSASVTWEQARDLCESLGGHLLTITSQEEQDFITELDGSKRGQWIGGWRPEDDEDGWQWITGEAWDYTNWYDGAPSNSYDTETGAMLWKDWAWNDSTPDSTSDATGYVCEWDQ